MAKNKYVWIFVSQSIAKCMRSAFRLRGKAGLTPPGSTMIPLMTMSPSARNHNTREDSEMHVCLKTFSDSDILSEEMKSRG